MMVRTGRASASSSSAPRWDWLLSNNKSDLSLANSQAFKVTKLKNHALPLTILKQTLGYVDPDRQVGIL